jgi:bacteriorhodopsin
MGCVLMLAFFIAIISEVKRVWKNLEGQKETKTHLVVALGCFFGFWPVFPVVWAFSKRTDLMTYEAARIIHLILDIGAKGVFGVYSYMPTNLNR